MIRFHRILVPVDFEESSQQALEMAVEFALTFDARLTIVHSWELVPYSYAGVYLAPELGNALEQAAKQRLAESNPWAACFADRFALTLSPESASKRRREPAMGDGEASDGQRGTRAGDIEGTDRRRSSDGARGIGGHLRAVRHQHYRARRQWASGVRDV